MIDLKYIDVNRQKKNEAMYVCKIVFILIFIKIFSITTTALTAQCTVGQQPVEYYFKIFNLFIQGETSVWWVAAKDFVRFISYLVEGEIPTLKTLPYTILNI